MQPDEAWLERFAYTTRQRILAYYRPDSCVASTRIGVGVLRHFGVLCRPQAVTLMAFTAAAAKAFAAGEKELPEHSVGIAGTGAITLGPDGRRRWDGHLVITLPQPAMLVDLSLDQVDRPEKGLHLAGPGICPLLDLAAFRAGETAVYSREDGTVLIYRPMNNGDWKQAPNWRDHPDFVSQIIHEVIGELE